MPDPDPLQPPRPGATPSAPSASHYLPELPYAEELQALLAGKYVVESFLGQGGMGAVYKGLQMPLKRPVAIKILQKRQMGVEDDFDFEERFKREAYAMAALTHPNIVHVYDCGDAGEHFLFISMELVDGGDLSDAIKGGMVTPEVALKLIGPICDGLQAAHDRGLVHRDIKPANIFLTADGKPKVADFGLAKKFDIQSTFMTKSGLGMGTPDYAAPEQYEGVSDIDHRADVYSLGVMFYQMLTGSLPRGAYKPPSQRVAVDPRLDAVLAKAMEQDRNERYQNVAEMKADVQQIVATWMSVTKPTAVPAQPQQATRTSAVPGYTGRVPTAQRPGSQAPIRTGPVPPRPHTHVTQSAPQPQKKSSAGMIIGVLGVIAVLAAGAFFMMKKTNPGGAPQDASPVVASAANTDNSSTPPMQPAPADTSPPPAPPSGNAAAVFSSFAPTAQWRAWLPPSEEWEEGWKRVGAEMHTEDKIRFHRFPENHANGGLRVRYRAIQEGKFLDLILRHAANNGVRYVVTLWTNGPRFTSAVDICSPPNGDPRRSIAPFSQDASFSLGAEHTAEFYAIGDKLTFFFNGQEVVSAQDATIADGTPAIFAGEGIQIVSAETCNLDSTLPSLAAKPGEPATPAAATMPAASAPSTAPLASAASSLSKVEPGWTDLLAGVDVGRDTVQGSWAMMPDGLKSDGSGAQVLQLNHAPPEEYDFDIEFTLLNEGSNVVQTLAVPGHWFTMRYFNGAACFGQNLDGKAETDPTRREAISPDAKFELKQRYQSRVEVRRGAVRLLINGKRVIEWGGDFKRLTPDPLFGVRDPKLIGVASFGTSVVFHKIAVRAADSAQEAWLALIATEPALASLEAGFKRKYDTEAQQPYLGQVAGLNQLYTASGIAKARTTAQAQGKFIEIAALDEEKARIQRGEGVPAEDAADTPAALKALRATYRANLAKIEADRARKATPVYDLYLSLLDNQVTGLTKANNIAHAQVVKAWRDQIAQKRAQLTPATGQKPLVASGTTTQGTSPATATGAKTVGGGSTWRAAAKFLVGSSATCVVLKGGVPINVAAEKDIPSGRFDITDINFDRLGSVLPQPKDADFQALAGLRDLRRVWVRVPESKLTASAFSFLAGNNELNWLNLEGVPAVADDLLVHLTGAKKLAFLGVQYAPDFTGKGLEKMPFVAAITDLDFLSSGITDEGMKAISACKQVRNLRLAACQKITDAGFAAMRSMKSLMTLSVPQTSFGDEAAAAIADLRALAVLDVNSSQLSDAGLMKLLALKSLTSLSLGGSKVTESGAAEFQKAMPQCKVTR